MKLVGLLLVILLIFVISITLGANNDQVVTFNYLLAQTECRLSTLLAILLGSGFVLGWLITGLFYLRVRLKLTTTQRKLKKLLKQYDEEVAKNRQIRLTSPTHRQINE